ncbi:PRA1 family protein-domain-containing protein [Pavlovales sp. CCMP2436]|nr:PRA1 family protein-domain-containing protein [Pavlovales sp. CCMP2436]|mmetsp:Transcript_35918/g.89670  ORF Transcript_35918/g.89670 Transcript_35918/m.89670 type:complete len:204 (-) Transcript_35918:134-745(-)
MLPPAAETDSLLGGRALSGFSAFSASYMAGALWESVQSVYTSNRAHTLVLARGFCNPLKFSRPADQSEALSRVRANWGTYRLFYGVIYSLVLIYTILSSPILLLGLATIGSAWAYLFVLHDAHTVVKVGQYELGRREKLFTLIPGTIIIIAISGALSSLVWVFILSTFVSLPHAMLHHTPELDALDVLELEGASLGGQQAFPM